MTWQPTPQGLSSSPASLQSRNFIRAKDQRTNPTSFARARLIVEFRCSYQVCTKRGAVVKNLSGDGIMLRFWLK